MFEGIVTSINDVLNRPFIFHNKSQCFYSGANSPISSVSSVGKECHECFWGELKQEKPQNFKCVVPKEGKLTFEKVDIIVVDPLDVGDVTVKDVVSEDVLINKISDSDVYSSGNAVNINDDLGILGGETKTLTRSEAGSPAGALLINSPSVGDKLKLDTVNGICVPFVAENSSLPISTAGHNFYCLIDSGAAVTAVSAKVWRECLSHAYPSLDKCSSECVTSVNGCQLTTIGKLLVKFVIDFRAFPFEVHVIEDLTCDVILGGDFLQKFCFTVDFENGMVRFFPESDPLPFKDVQLDDDVVNPDETFISPVHASRTFVIPSHSEILVPGRLDDLPASVVSINGMLAPKTNLCHRYSVFGASELVSVADDGTVPVRIANPSSQPVTIYRRTRLANFEEVDQNIATFEITASDPIGNPSLPDSCSDQFEQCDYSELPDLSESVLSDGDRIKFRNLFKKYRDVFAFPGDQLGRTSLVQHVIDTDDAMRSSKGHTELLLTLRKRLTVKWRKCSRMELFMSLFLPGALQSFWLKRRMGRTDFVDFRKLHKVTKLDSFPMPLVADALDSLAGKSLFSCLDLKSGFWQIQMHSASREKTAFVTHNGLYEFLTMPFGLSNSGASFQRLMGYILRGLEYRFALIYIDDIIIFSKSVEEHLSHPWDVFRRLREANVKLNPKKCNFVKQTVEYLGHVVTPAGISPNPDKVRVVQEFPTPSNLNELRNFLGLANYYRRFVKGCSHIAAPLNALTRKGVSFKWSEQCAVAFDKLKRALVSAPVLAYPNFCEPFLLFVDASSTGIGFTLGQVQNGKERK